MPGARVAGLPVSTLPLRLLLLLLGLLLNPAPALAVAAASDDEAIRRAERIARQHVAAHLGELGLSRAETAEMVLRDGYASRHLGVVHLHFQQVWQGLEVANALLSVHVDAEGRVVAVGNRFARGLGELDREPRVAPAGAYEAAARVLRVPLEPGSRPQRVSDEGARGLRERFAGGSLSSEEVPVHLVWWQRPDGSLALAWQLEVRVPDGRHWLQMWIDAKAARLLGYDDWVGRLDGPVDGRLDGRVGTSGSGAGADRRSGVHRYRVFGLPAMDPLDGDRVLVEELVGEASLYGWHDTDGRPGAEYADTQGNNAVVLTREGYKAPLGDGLLFDPDLDLGQPPAAYRDAVLVNAFYWLNLLHDLHYRFGFDEAAGNFQQNNYGRGGVGGDPVVARAQVDDIITFATPPDGRSPVSHLFLATPRTALLPVRHTLTVLDAEGGPLASVPASGADFGPVLDRRGVEAPLVAAANAGGRRRAAPGNGLLVRGASTSGRDACSELSNASDVAGRLVLVEAGGCTAPEVARNAQRAGAAGVVVVMPPGSGIRTLGGYGAGSDIEIPLVAVKAEDLEPALAAAGQPTPRVLLHSNFDQVIRDSGFDSGVLIHEYGHGVANRLTGGPSSVGCLQKKQSAALVEGVADVWALAFTGRAEHAPETPRSLSTYVFFQDRDGTGVRGVPYTSDTARNPLTYGDLRHLQDDGLLAHAAGVRWAALLWEVYWNLVKEHGFTTDLVAGEGGNTLFLQLLTDSLKLQPCHPTFVDARDAFLLADEIASRGAHRCPIWRGFARRGLGVGATAGADADDLAVEESFAVPPECRIEERQTAAAEEVTVGDGGSR